MKKIPFVAAALVAAALSGCAVSRPPQSVEAPTPPQWYAPLPHNGTLSGLTAWWLQFNDPLLAELIEAGQVASPTVASARSRIQQARSARVVTGAALLPSLDAQASISRGNAELGLPQPATVAQIGVQTAWEIDLFGARGGAADAAQARLLQAQAGWHDARVSVAAETANSYISLRTCELQLAVTTNDARSRAETSRLSQLSEQAGFTAPASAALARASAAEGSARATQQRAQCNIEVTALSALTAIPEPQLRQKLAGGAMIHPQSSMLSVTALPAQVLTQRPDVYQAELEVSAASAEVGAARADRYPRLTLSGNVGVGRVRVNGATTDGSTWSIGPVALTLPIFDGGRRAAATDAAQARYEEAVTLYQARVRQAVREVQEALVNLESARSRNEDARIATDGYRASFTATEARYKGGLASLVELEDARRTALAAETALVALQRERVAAWIALYRAAGGGWTRPDTTSMGKS